MGARKRFASGLAQRFRDLHKSDLARPINTVSPEEAGVEPLRRVRRGHLVGEHVAALIKIGACVAFESK